MSKVDRRTLLAHAAWSVPTIAVATTAPAYAASNSMDVALWQTSQHVPAAAGTDAFRIGWVASAARPTIGLVITLRAYEVYKAPNAAGVVPTLETSNALLTLGQANRSTDTAYRVEVEQGSSRVMNTWVQTITLPAGFTSPGTADFQINWPNRNGVAGSWQYTFEITQRLASPIGETSDDNSGNDVLLANRASNWVRTEPTVNRWASWDNATLDNTLIHRQYGSIPSVGSYTPTFTAPTLG